jgi:hypothetical protein
MLALYEPEMESRTLLSTDAREESALLSALDDHDTRPPTLASDNDVFSALVPDDTTWKVPAVEQAPLESEPASEIALDAVDPETDNMLAQYFGEVRRFALLSFAEEQALGRRIERWQRRLRWALYTSPVALPTLLRLWQQVEQQEISAGYPGSAGAGHTSGASGYT